MGGGSGGNGNDGDGYALGSGNFGSGRIELEQSRHLETSLCLNHRYLISLCYCLAQLAF